MYKRQADEGLADRDGHDAARALDKAALADADVRAEHDDADTALLEVQRHAERAVFKAEQMCIRDSAAPVRAFCPSLRPR